MAVPAANKFYRAVLEVSDKSGESLSAAGMVERVIAHLRLTGEQLQEMVPSGVKTRIEDRTQWATFHLQRAGLLERPQRGLSRITQRGREYLTVKVGDIETEELKSLQSEGSQWNAAGNSPAVAMNSNRGPTSSAILAGEGKSLESSPSMRGVSVAEITPNEQMEASYQAQLQMLADETLESVKSITPAGFERLVVELLANMGYGDGKVVGRSGDHGIDGVLNQDTLGMEKIYVQAKRFESAQVPEPEIRNFSGSLDPYGATKGVFITTSTFSSTARQTAEHISRGGKFIRLIDGKELAELMICHGVGVVTEITYEVKKLDANYFIDL